MKTIALPTSMVGVKIYFTSEYENGDCMIKFCDKKSKYFILSTSISLLGEEMKDRESFGYLSSWAEDTHDDRTITFTIPEFVTIVFGGKTQKRTEAHLKKIGASTVKDMVEIRKKRNAPVFEDSIIKCPYSGRYMKKSMAQEINGVKYHPSLDFAQCRYSGDWFVVPDQGSRHGSIALKREYEYMWRKCEITGIGFYNPRRQTVYSYENDSLSERDLSNRALNENYFVFESVWYPLMEEDKFTHDDIRIPQRLVGEYSVCEECGCLYVPDSYTCCPSCRIDYSDPIKNYSWKFNIKQKYNEMRYGLEMEFECGSESRYDNAMDMCDEFNQKIVCKSDGSLSYGFEVVTKPYPYDEILELGKAIARKASDIGCKALDTCGVHIHVSRRFISDHQLALLLLVFSEYKSDIELVARRNSDRWAKISKKDKSEMIMNEGGFIQTHKNNGRYQGINLENEHTIEFRIFKGTKTESIIEEYITFVHDIIEACNHITVDDIGVLKFKEILQKGK